MINNEDVNVLVIGLGPAGIMATYRLYNSNVSILAVDRGKPYFRRESTCPYDVANGFGGAGLFSDGKLSFFPAASNLWANTEKVKLRKSYDYVQTQLTPIGYRFPKWQNGWTITKPSMCTTDMEKYYKTTYFDEQERTSFVENMYNHIQPVTKLCTEVLRIDKYKGLYHAILNNDVNGLSTVIARRIILATGKAGNIIFDSFFGSNFSYIHRYEGGIRIETNSDNFKPFDFEQIDYKFIEKIGDLEFRTFCSCKNGKVLQSNYIRNVSYNGSISSKPTGRSNIGMIIRSENKECKISQELISCVGRNDSYVYDYDEDYDIERNYWIGTEFDKLLSERLKVVLKSIKSKHEIKIYGPEIEYFGKYPVFNWSTLKSSNEKVWIVGDLSCKYRGIVAALLSGVYAANEVVFDCMKNENTTIYDYDRKIPLLSSN